MRVETYSHPGRHVARSASGETPLFASAPGKRKRRLPDRGRSLPLRLRRRVRVGARPDPPPARPALLRRRHPAGAAGAGREIRQRCPISTRCIISISANRTATAAGAGRVRSTRRSSTRRSTCSSAPAASPSWRRIIRLLAPLVKARRTADLLDSTLAWNLVCDLYDREMPHESFLHFFWAWRALFGGLVATLSFPLPPARVYHTVSTGYAGLLAARATVETGRPALITEHGIYTNERRIEILQADWIVDTVDKGFAIHDPRRDLRDFWSVAFESYARACYQACAEVITLHGANQPAQTIHGAAPGADEDHSQRGRLSGAQPPAAGRARTIRRRSRWSGASFRSRTSRPICRPSRCCARRFPDLVALVMGPTDEQPDYYQECKAVVAELGLVRHRALHRPGRRHPIFPAHPRERADQRERSRSR